MINVLGKYSVKRAGKKSPGSLPTSGLTELLPQLVGFF
jgi:hypothetical protein